MGSAAGSDHFYPNNLARITLLALEDVMGTNGMNALLRLANKNEYIGKLPPDNPDLEFDFADFSMIHGALHNLYGPHGSRVLGLRAGEATFNETLRIIGEAVDVNDHEFAVLPVAEKVRVGISLVGITFTQSTGNFPVIREENKNFIYSITNCPVCWGRKTNEPSCHFFAGLIMGAMKWVTRGINFDVIQRSARSCGDISCDFLIPKNPAANQ